MIADVCYIPLHDEDGHFIARERRVIGVADGIGWWKKNKGIDAGIFAKQLMKHSKALVERWPCGLSDPAEIINVALSMTTAKGTSTACVVSLKGKWLHAAVLGDSGFAVVRDKVIYRSPRQQKRFNTPYRLGKASFSGDSPLDALRITVAVKRGDLVVLGTDGLFDNMFDDELAGVIASSRKKGEESPEALARNIAMEAEKLSKEKGRRSPFYRECLRSGQEDCRPGGKPDDITVVVARVTCTCG